MALRQASGAEPTRPNDVVDSAFKGDRAADELGYALGNQLCRCVVGNYVVELVG